MSGFLAGAQHACGIDFREANEFVGTSAGSIVAAHLANGIEPRVPQQSDELAQSDVTDRDIPMAGIDRAFRGGPPRNRVERAHPLAKGAVNPGHWDVAISYIRLCQLV